MAPAICIMAYIMPISPAISSTISYRYDSNGRLISACDAKPDYGQMTTYTYDRSDNRYRYSSTRTDQKLLSDQAIYSPNGNFQFRMQSDGNLVVYQKSETDWVPLGWATYTVGTGATDAYFQSDGNLVLYTSTGQPVWSSDTYIYHCAVLAVKDDGNVTITSPDGVIVWQTGTGGH